MILARTSRAQSYQQNRVEPWNIKTMYSEHLKTGPVTLSDHKKCPEFNNHSISNSFCPNFRIIFYALHFTVKIQKLDI
jgi:hypothetical protein